jgi:DNA-binding NarL/FixJ family response regulator
MKISVLLADDSEILRKVIAGLLQGDPEIEVVVECVSLAQTIELASKLHPQVIVLDVHMGEERTVTPSQLKFGLIGSPRNLGLVLASGQIAPDVHRFSKRLWLEA